MFIFGDMGLEYGNEKRVCTPFDVVLAFFVSVLIVLKFVGEYNVTIHSVVPSVGARATSEDVFFSEGDLAKAVIFIVESNSAHKQIADKSFLIVFFLIVFPLPPFLYFYR